MTPKEILEQFEEWGIPREKVAMATGARIWSVERWAKGSGIMPGYRTLLERMYRREKKKKGRSEG